MSRSTLWPASISTWFVAGFAFPSLIQATLLLSTRLQPHLVSATGMTDEMAYYVAATLVRIPVTAVLGVLVAAAQCAVNQEVRPAARGWIVGAAIGAAVSTLIWLPSTLVAREFSGGTVDSTVPTLMLMFGAALMCGLVWFVQSQAVRAKVLIPGGIVVTSLLAAAIGALISSLTTFHL